MALGEIRDLHGSTAASEALLAVLEAAWRNAFFAKGLGYASL